MLEVALKTTNRISLEQFINSLANGWFAVLVV